MAVSHGRASEVSYQGHTRCKVLQALIQALHNCTHQLSQQDWSAFEAACSTYGPARLDQGILWVIWQHIWTGNNALPLSCIAVSVSNQAHREAEDCSSPSSPTLKTLSSLMPLGKALTSFVKLLVPSSMMSVRMSFQSVARHSCDRHAGLVPRTRLPSRHLLSSLKGVPHAALTKKSIGSHTLPFSRVTYSVISCCCDGTLDAVPCKHFAFKHGLQP